MTSQKHTVIIGGGIIGGFAAWYLAQTGRKVTLIEQAQFGKAASHGNCGYVSPSHVIPLARPGQLTKAIKGMLSRQTALRIEPTKLFSLAPWLLKFALRCNSKNMMEAGQACHPLLQSSATLYRDVFEQQNPRQLERRSRCNILALQSWEQIEINRAKNRNKDHDRRNECPG